MNKIIRWVKNNPNRTMFLIPIILVAGISISHVVSWYNLANPISWAIYLSIAIEIGAMTALVAATNKIKGGVWIMFGLITFIQMIGNIFFSYKEIDVNGDLFKSWMELTSPVWEALGSKIDDTIALKRWLAFLEGGLLPIISLTSLHFFVNYDDGKTNTDDKVIINEETLDDEPEVKNVVKENVETYKESKKKILNSSLINLFRNTSLSKTLKEVNRENLELLINPNQNDETITTVSNETNENNNRFNNDEIINNQIDNNGDYKFEVFRNNEIEEANVETNVETEKVDLNDNFIKTKRLTYKK